MTRALKVAVGLLVLLVVAAQPIAAKLREEAPSTPQASRIGLGPLLGGVMTGAFRPLLMNYLYIRADILAGQGRFDEQVTLFRSMVQLYPHNEAARGYLGWELAFNSKGEAESRDLAWRWAREGLDIVTLLCSNRAYRILQVELSRAGIKTPGPGALALTQLDNPSIDWTSLARGFGVEAVSVETAEQLEKELERAIADPGPRFIELLLA